MRRLILFSFEKSSTGELGITPFLLSTETENAPSLFEVVFLVDNIRYRYGFEVDDTGVHAEWLYEAVKQSEKPLFIREKDGIEVMEKSFPEGKDLEERTRDNALFWQSLINSTGKQQRRSYNGLAISLQYQG